MRQTQTVCFYTNFIISHKIQKLHPMYMFVDHSSKTWLKSAEVVHNELKKPFFSQDTTHIISTIVHGCPFAGSAILSGGTYEIEISSDLSLSILSALVTEAL